MIHLTDAIMMNRKRTEVKDVAEYTPMMQQYLKTKEEYKDCILFYRLGDFYEMFFDDAIVVSKELELTLTGKSCGAEERAPMCGVPYHAVEGYLNKLVANGHKVAICEQVEDPKLAKGLVKREVIRIVTPGTNTDMQALDESKNNYIMCIVYLADKYGISLADISTGDYFVTEVDTERKLIDEINKFAPSEIICNESFYMSGVDLSDMKNRLGIAVYSLEAWYFSDETAENTLKDHFKVQSLEGLGLSDYACGTIAAGALLRYLYETQKNDLGNLSAIHPYSTGKYMIIDSSTRRNLELVETLREKQKRGSLLWVLDKTKTAMGARTLRAYVEQPLIDKTEIELRQEAIGELNDHVITREELREYLNPIYDLERLITRVTYRTANPRDLIAFKNSISMLPPIKSLLDEFDGALLKNIQNDIDAMEELCSLVDRSIMEEPPISVREGGLIKEGYNEDVDKYRNAKTEGKTWLAELEAKEREKTGIKNLKIKYNKVFGYYLEVTNSYKDLVPEDYIRKQTLANAERYITQELKEYEEKILGAEDKILVLETQLYAELVQSLSEFIPAIQINANQIARLDCLLSFATAARENNYIRPVIADDDVLEIHQGRHPVIEKQLPIGEKYIANDVMLDSQTQQIIIITGPNMAGKSALLRQTALITLLAQIGSFVPAESAHIGLVDKIFTRVGASDNISVGESTFMVEMNEAADILNNLSPRSLVLFDELGRGTSTYDGISIAWAIVEHIHEHPKAKARTLFATHYHELNEMEKSFKRIKNYNVSVKEIDNKVIFLRKLERGGSEHSFGIHVAKMAGMPKSIVKRANDILKQLETDNRQQGISSKPMVEVGETRGGMQLSFFQLDDPVLCQIRDEILNLDVNNLTPLEALNKLNDIKRIVKGK